MIIEISSAVVEEMIDAIESSGDHEEGDVAEYREVLAAATEKAKKLEQPFSFEC